MSIYFLSFFFFFFNDTATTEIYTLSLPRRSSDLVAPRLRDVVGKRYRLGLHGTGWEGSSRKQPLDRKSTRLNSSHSSISYAVFCLKKKKKKKNNNILK